MFTIITIPLYILLYINWTMCTYDLHTFFRSLSLSLPSQMYVLTFVINLHLESKFRPFTTPLLKSIFNIHFYTTFFLLSKCFEHFFTLFSCQLYATGRTLCLNDSVPLLLVLLLLRFSVCTSKTLFIRNVRTILFMFRVCICIYSFTHSRCWISLPDSSVFAK